MWEENGDVKAVGALIAYDEVSGTAEGDTKQKGYDRWGLPAYLPA